MRDLRPLLVALLIMPAVLVGSWIGTGRGQGTAPPRPPADAVQQAQTPQAVPSTRPEHASPYGKAVGEKVPGAKRVIGALAYQRYLTRPSSPPPSAPARLPAPGPAPDPGTARRAVAAIVAAVLIFGGMAVEAPVRGMDPFRGHG
jgi:hypothetical protein